MLYDYSRAVSHAATTQSDVKYHSVQETHGDAHSEDDHKMYDTEDASLGTRCHLQKHTLPLLPLVRWSCSAV